MKRKDSEDEACMSRLLDFTKNKDCCRLTYLASMDSDKSYKSSIEGFIVSVTLTSISDSVLNSILDLLSDYDVDFDVIY